MDSFDEEWQMGRCNLKRVRLWYGHNLPICFRWYQSVYQKPLGISRHSLNSLVPPSRAQAWEGLGLGAWAGGLVWKESNREMEAFHGVPFAAIPIPEDTGACKMSSMMMIGSCIILNCCNSKIAKCFTTLMRVAFFLHSQIVRSNVQQLHFSRFSALAWPSAPCRSSQEEVPRAKARQQLREAQITMPVGGLSEGDRVAMGGERFKIHRSH